MLAQTSQQRSTRVPSKVLQQSYSVTGADNPSVALVSVGSCLLAWLFLSTWLFLCSCQKETSGRLRSRRTRIPRKGRATGREEPGRRRGAGRAKGSRREARAQSRAREKGREEPGRR